MTQIKNLPRDFQPDGKAFSKGVESLGDEELLAIILRSGYSGRTSLDVARELLNYSGNSLLGLCQLSLSELQKVSGIGRVKALQLKCMIELSIRISQQSYREMVVLNEPDSIANYYMEELRHLQHEKIMLACFDAKCQLLGDEVLSIGTATGAFTNPREIFKRALLRQAVSIVLLHNHPSGDPNPSRQDIKFTKDVKLIGELLEIPLMDHIVIGDRRFVSMRQANMY